jgi:actin-related protein
MKLLKTGITNFIPTNFCRIFDKLPEALDVEIVEVFVNRRDIDARFLSWKGGATLATFETAEELWIKDSEWQLGGFKTLREKAPFGWK